MNLSIILCRFSHSPFIDPDGTVHTVSWTMQIHFVLFGCCYLDFLTQYFYSFLTLKSQVRVSQVALIKACDCLSDQQFLVLAVEALLERVHLGDRCFHGGVFGMIGLQNRSAAGSP